MGNRNAAPSSKNEHFFLPDRLSEVLRGIIPWMYSSDLTYKTKFPWSKSHLSVVLRYVLGVEAINSKFFAESPAYMCLNQVWPRKSEEFRNPEKYVDIVAAFLAELHELFQVPRLQHSPCDNNELIVFITFLLQLLEYKTEFFVSFEGQILRLKKELRFLVGILGDTPFQGQDGDELEGVDKLFAEFEAVANEAGKLVRSFIFTTRELFKSGRADKALSVMLEHIDLLKANIIEFSWTLPFVTNDKMKPTTCVVESDFIVDTVLNDLEGLMNRDGDPLCDVKDKIKVLHEGLALSWSLLKDIKLNMGELRELARRTRDVAYEAEYLINTCLIGDVPVWYIAMRLPHVIHTIELIGTRLQEIKQVHDTGALQVPKDLGAQLSLQTKRNLDVDEIIVGFEEEEIKILSQLVGGTKHLQVNSIFGMPGLGKTTLAKKLHSHPSVNYHFDRCSWCVVSQTYQRKNLLIEILMCLGSELGKVKMLNMNEESLAESMYKILKGRRYLIVMDDVWDPNVLDGFLRYFPNDENGSRILFTSRNKDVAPPNSIIHAISSLSNDQCWELLKRKVFQNEPCPPQLLGIGKEIAANCNGLPLAVIVIAGILSTMEKEKSTWMNVERSLASYILSDQSNAVVRILKLSYEHLPEHLKPCFIYFGAFPKKKEIHVEKLKRLWVAEGFIRKVQNKSIESITEDYLVELINKSLLKVERRRSNGGVKTCVVHDLLRDLCLKIAEEENFIKAMYNGIPMYEKHHRLRVWPFDDRVHFGPFGFHVRSVSGYLEDTSLCLHNMKLLRVLDLPKNSLLDGGGIEHHVHLRYLAVKRMQLASIVHLVNLEFLILTDDLIHLSSVIQKMVKLRCLSASKAIFEQDYYLNNSHTNNLEFLSTVWIRTLEDEEMLKCSPHLRKLKCTCRPFLDEKDVYRYPDLHFLTQLESLSLTHCAWGDSHPTGPQVNLHSNIKKLTLYGLCLPWEKMSIIGELPNLQVLQLRYRAFMGETWETRDGEFQQLIFLKLHGLDIAQWNVASTEHFPKLQQLVLHYCKSLQEIPCEIGDIVTLQLIEVVRCSNAMAESARKIQQEQQENGNEELKVIIRDTFTG